MNQECQDFCNARRAYFQAQVEAECQRQLAEISNQCDKIMILSKLQEYLSSEKWQSLASRKDELSEQSLFDLLQAIQSG